MPDLSNTKWFFDEPVDITEDYHYNIHFKIRGGTEFTSISVSSGVIYYDDIEVYNGEWPDFNNRIILIIDGNPDEFDDFYNHVLLRKSYKVYDLSGSFAWWRSPDFSH